MLNHLLIMRGIPGSGKSTYIKKVIIPALNELPDTAPLIFSADKYFCGNDLKEYKFDPNQLKKAHSSCMRSFLDQLKISEFNFYGIVDNTNIRLWEFMGYVQVAEAYGVPVTIIRMETPPLIASDRNIHGVPEDKVMNMAKYFEKTPKWLNEKVIQYGK